jgi:hypothetical protein
VLGSVCPLSSRAMVDLAGARTASSAGSADRERQIVPDPGRTPLRPGLNFRYTQMVSPVEQEVNMLLDARHPHVSCMGEDASARPIP